jgi:hypothetical protein
MNINIIIQEQSNKHRTIDLTTEPLSEIEYGVKSKLEEILNKKISNASNYYEIVKSYLIDLNVFERSINVRIICYDSNGGVIGQFGHLKTTPSL